MELNAKEKAKELFDKCRKQIVDTFPYYSTKLLVKNICDEILDILEDDGLLLASAEYHDKKTVEFWLLVKKEVELCN